MPGFSILIDSIWVLEFILAVAVAVTPVPGPPIVTVGDVVYPRPDPVISISETLNWVPPTEHVAAAPDPPPPLIVIVGGVMYPDPALVISSLWIDWTLPILVVIATASATL